MKNFKGVAIAVLAVALTAGAAWAHGPGGTGSMGPGSMMDRGTMGPGMMMHRGMMMGPGMMMHRGMMGRDMMGFRGRVTPDFQLKTGDVKSYFERRLARTGNERLKLGKVTAKDKDTIIAEIVTVDNSLVRRYEIDRHTGLVRATK